MRFWRETRLLLCRRPLRPAETRLSARSRRAKDYCLSSIRARRAAIVQLAIVSPPLLAVSSTMPNCRTAAIQYSAWLATNNRRSLILCAVAEALHCSRHQRARQLNRATWPRQWRRPSSRGAARMLNPDHYHAILTIMRYGSLVLALLFASKIVAYAAHVM